MITCTTSLVVKPGKEAALEELLLNFVERVKANEPGTTQFYFAKDKADASHYFLFEQYADEEAFKLHGEASYLQPMVDKLLPLLSEPPNITQYTALEKTSTEQQTSGHHRIFKKNGEPFFHVGMIVPDLAKAMDDYSRILGVNFTEAEHFDVKRLEDPTPHEHKPFVAFTREGPPYIELIEASGEGIFSDAQEQQILYLGCWEENMSERIKMLEKEGIKIDAYFRNNEGEEPFCIITSAEGPLGIRIEYVSTSFKPIINEWVETGHVDTGG